MRTEIRVSKDGSVYCNKRILFVHETKDNNREQNTVASTIQSLKDSLLNVLTLTFNCFFRTYPLKILG